MTVLKLRPDNPKEFVEGKLGVLLPTFPRTDLVVAFRYLNGGHLSKVEQGLRANVDRIRPGVYGELESAGSGTEEDYRASGKLAGGSRQVCSACSEG